MTIGKIIVLAVIIAMGCAAAVFTWPRSVDAQESHCDNLDSLMEIGEAYADFEIFGAVGYEGALTDTTVIYRAAGHIWAMGFKDGCYVVGPVPVEPAAPPPTVPDGTPA
jgi:hypothetical protein